LLKAGHFLFSLERLLDQRPATPPHVPGLLLVAFIGSYIGKSALNKLDQKNFRRIVLVLVFLIGLTTLGKFVEQISH
jgi:uncharacterized membrane protein YfcA